MTNKDTDSDLDLSLDTRDQNLNDGSEEEDQSDIHSDDLDDIELLKECSREDLFMLVQEDPKYYCDLIRENKLCDQLSIKIFRSDDGGGLNIKFRIYPEDRWCEVGYWGDSTDQEVYHDFKTQISNLLNRNRHGKTKSQYGHLESQLDKNNDIMSGDYGHDLKNINKMNQNLFKTPLEKKLESIMDEKTTQPAQNPTSSKKRKHPPENLKENLQSQAEHLREKPIDYLNQFVAELIDKIIGQISNLIEIDPTCDYQKIIASLEDDFIIPKSCLEIHQTLIENVKSCAYLQRIHSLTEWDSYPVLQDYLIDFHREAMRHHPALYTKIKKEKLLELLDDDDQEILEKYCLDVQEVWLNYLNNQDE